MSSRPKAKPQNRVDKRPVITPETLHNAQLAAFTLGRYVRQMPQSQPEADEFSMALSVWVRLGDRLPEAMQTVRTTLLEAVQIARERAANPLPPPSGLLGADGLPIDAERKLYV